MTDQNQNPLRALQLQRTAVNLLHVLSSLQITEDSITLPVKGNPIQTQQEHNSNMTKHSKNTRLTQHQNVTQTLRKTTGK